METVPTDPVNGKPLKYAAGASSRFLLYSIGGDLQDDGGTRIEHEPEALLGSLDWYVSLATDLGYGTNAGAKPFDWVWP